jgi:hypothetical protein
MASNGTFLKRQKERARTEKQRAKEVKRRQRREDATGSPVRGEGGVDPDIAGIVPGPQPVADDS